MSEYSDSKVMSSASGDEVPHERVAGSDPKKSSTNEELSHNDV